MNLSSSYFVGSLNVQPYYKIKNTYKYQFWHLYCDK